MAECIDILELFGTEEPLKEHYTCLSNMVMHNPTLSVGAKEIYALMQSYITIPGFILHRETIKHWYGKGERAFRCVWNNLKSRGYLKQYRIPSGHRGGWEYHYDLLDEPDTSTTFRQLKMADALVHQPFTKTDKQISKICLSILVSYAIIWVEKSSQRLKYV